MRKSIIFSSNTSTRRALPLSCLVFELVLPPPSGLGRGVRYGTTFSVKAQKCMGGKPPAPGPTPGGPYCVHDAPTNTCGTCTTPEDCGGNKTDWSLCWANMDEKCTDSDAALVRAYFKTIRMGWFFDVPPPDVEH